MIAFASSLDQAGTLTRSAEDSALLLQAMAGFDPRDSTSVDRPAPDYMTGLGDDLKGLRIGLPREYFDEGLNPDTAARVRAALAEYEKLGAFYLGREYDLQQQASPCPTPGCRGLPTT